MKKSLKKILFFLIVPIKLFSFNKNDEIVKSLYLGRQYGIKTDSKLINSLPKNVTQLSDNQKEIIVSQIKDEEKVFAIKALIISLLKREEKSIKSLLEKIKSLAAEKSSELDQLIQNVTDSVDRVHSQGFSVFRVNKILQEINEIKKSIPENLKVEIKVSIQGAHGKVGVTDILALFRMMNSRM